MRPSALEQVVGQEHLLGERAAFRRLVEGGRLGSSLFVGPPGSGKTTVARIVAARLGEHVLVRSAVDATVADLRAVVADAERRLASGQGRTVVVLDEVHRLSRPQQEALLEALERGVPLVIGVTTENPVFALASAVLSRLRVWRFEPLQTQHLERVVRRALDQLGREADARAIELVARLADGDARAALGIVEAALSLVPHGVLDPDAVSAACATRLVHHGRDEHYDQLSAFIKSIRGSDADAGLYWMVRLLQAGEDPRLIARRLVILASEDIGLADPDALVVAEAAARAVEHVGMPEAELVLGEAVVYLALAPKSNSVTRALARAKADVWDGPAGEVPAHLADPRSLAGRALSQAPSAARYRSPHDAPSGWVEQAYRPAGVEGHVYYEPSPHGREPALARELRRRRGASSRQPPPHEPPERK
jgi:putative ATPase